MRWCVGLALGRTIKRSEGLDLGLAARRSVPNVLLTSNVVCILYTFFVSGLIEETSLLLSLL